ncbi:PRC-barrel domain-containing protein [Geoglobus acetivorans]|uniref:PRC-barrel domain-containing protein n=1 Tax=Geoglobus acetivorans TaxID=565033 RepID=A0ABZ3H5Y3_GEOAI|nr:PRC-barrel domain-containing protein [Geoglobus acetivorans]
MIGEVSSVLGLRVYTDEGRYVGRVADLSIDIEARQVKGLAIVDVNRMLINTRANGVIIPYRFVKAVGDIVIIKDLFRKMERKKSEEES